MDPLDEAIKLVELLRDVEAVCERKRNSAAAMREVGLFVGSLKKTIAFLERWAQDRRRARVEGTPDMGNLLLASGTAGTFLAAQWHPGSRLLFQDLRCATHSLLQVLKVPRNLWNLATLILRLRSLRESIVESAQTNMHVPAFDLASDEERRQEEEDVQRKRQEMPKNILQAHGALKAFPHSVRRNFSSFGAGHPLAPAELQLRSPPAPAQTSRATEPADEPVADLDPGSDRNCALPKRDASQARPAGTTTETEAFFADVLANLEVMRASQESQEAQQRSRPTEDEMAEWFEDPITGEIMSDPIKCTDGRTYDRWTIIDHKMVKCPYDASMVDFRIAFDDIDMRARLFRAFPDKEQAYRARRQAHRQSALDHVRRGELRDAVTKLNHVLQWNAHDEECKAQRDRAQLRLQPPPAPDARPPASGAALAPSSSSGARSSLRERMRRCSITGWLHRLRSR